MIPQLRTGLVTRPRLVGKLNEGLDGRLTVISAPAGFGKTTLAAAWIKQLPISDHPWTINHCAWISLDNNDNEATRFIHYLIAAIQTIYPGLGNEQLDIVENASKPVLGTITHELLNQITAQNQPLLIAFDDYHEIQNDEIHQVLQNLVEYLPPMVHILITTRETPQLPLPRWRSRNWLNEVSSNELRFNETEASDFLRDTMQLDLSADAAALLEKRTEGWVAGLQLAALSLAETDYSQLSIEQFGGQDRFVTDYLLTEVLERQTTEVKDFLLGTSILDRFNPELCTAVLRSDEAPDLTRSYQSLITNLELSNLFIVPLDRERYWYRYHHMFAGLLRQHLEQSLSKDKVNELYRRAAHWCMEKDLLEEAAMYALRGDDHAFAAHLISNMELDGLWNQSLGLQLPEWGKTLPADVLQEYPLAAIYIAGAHMARHDVKETIHFMELVREDPRVEAEIKLFDSIFIRNTGDVKKAYELAMQASEHLQGRNRILHIMAKTQAVVCLISSGDMTAAEQLAESIRSEARHGMEKILNVHVQIDHILAIVKMHLAKFKDAEKIFIEGIEAIERSGKTLPLIGLLQVQLASLYYEWNEIEKAAEYCKVGFAWGERTGVGDIIAEGLSVQVRLAILEQDKAATNELLDKLSKIMDWPEFSDTRSSLQAGRAFFELQLGNLAAALQWVDESGYTLDDSPSLIDRNKYLIYAILLFEKNRQSGMKDQVPQIIGLVDRLIDLGTTHGLNEYLISALTLKALLLDLLGQTKDALTSLDAALERARPGNFIRTFLDFGQPLRDLLQSSLKTDSNTEYKHGLLSGFNAESVIRSASNSSKNEMLVSLTSREKEILQLIAAGLSNKAIEGNLTLSGNTVRSHIKSLYSKLGVHSRTQAIRLAKEKGLL